MDAMRGYHPRMLDIATQLMLKWERRNADDTVDVPADMTRLTLDTIALCGFDYRFNSFYRDTPHPFVLAMLNTLEAAQAVARELPIQTKLKPGRAKKVRAAKSSWSRPCVTLLKSGASRACWARSTTFLIGC
jgi:cytochrome P450